jgi:hypothetical protein
MKKYNAFSWIKRSFRDQKAKPIINISAVITEIKAVIVKQVLMVFVLSWYCGKYRINPKSNPILEMLLNIATAETSAVANPTSVVG